MSFSFRSSVFILLLALLIPIDLPAGGSLRKNSSVIRYSDSNLYLANHSCFLRSSPNQDGFCLRYIPIGTPLRFVRSWKSLDGKMWLQVQIPSLDILENTLLPAKGWINV